jgi:hypothetical protein
MVSKLSWIVPLALGAALTVAFATGTAGAGGRTVLKRIAGFIFGHQGFSFVGADHDDLAIAGATSVGSWVINDISVTDNIGRGGGDPAAPESRSSR